MYNRGICYEPALALNTHNDIMYLSLQLLLQALCILFDIKNRAIPVLITIILPYFGGETCLLGRKHTLVSPSPPDKTLPVYPVLWIAYTACNIMPPHVAQSLTVLRIQA